MAHPDQYCLCAWSRVPRLHVVQIGPQQSNHRR